MNINLVKQELEINGYKAFIKETSSHIYEPKYILGGLHDDKSKIEMDSAFQVFIENGKIFVGLFNQATLKSSIF